MNKRIAYYSLGCKVNLYESEAVVNKFIDNGFTLVDFDEVADVYIINTCSVTSTGDSKSRKIIREAVRKNKDAVIFVMGCYAQLSPTDIESIDGVDIIIGTNNRAKAYDLIMERLNMKDDKVNLSYFEDILKVKEYEELGLTRFSDKTRGFIKVQDGCDNYCSYCTVPYARGHIKSRKIEDAVREVKALCDNGVKEIVLSGINTGAYGKDIGLSLKDLLSALVQIDNLGKLRISSIESSEITEELVKFIFDNKEHFCDHFHIPLQAGCNKTLKNMKRKYVREEYLDKINLIRSYFKDANITSDILTGFAYETEEDFLDGYEFIKSIGYGEIHVFPYSRRPKTIAYAFGEQVDDITKKNRVSKLLELNNELALNYRNKFLGKEVLVLVEKKKGNVCFGHSTNYLEIEFESSRALVNEYYKVKITKVAYPRSIAEVIE